MEHHNTVSCLVFEKYYFTNKNFVVLIITDVGQGGASGGQCAGGFGVCCYFLAECGRTYSQNLTYWTKTAGTATSPCTINVCKCQAEVCFLRLDFNSFNLYQPDTDTTAANPTLAGQCVQVRAGRSSSLNARCCGAAGRVDGQQPGRRARPAPLRHQPRLSSLRGGGGRGLRAAEPHPGQHRRHAGVGHHHHPGGVSRWAGPGGEIMAND